jgi:hypothetical protein
MPRRRPRRAWSSSLDRRRHAGQPSAPTGDDDAQEEENDADVARRLEVVRAARWQAGRPLTGDELDRLL